MLRTVAGLRDRAPRPWTGSWTEPSVQPVRSGPSAARLRSIPAASACDARSHTSCERQAAVRARSRADEPRPAESFPYGSPDLRRLRAGRYRVFYTIDEERRVFQVDHVARLP